MKKFIVSALAFSPMLAFAQAGNLNNVQFLLQRIGNLVGLALPIVVGLALLGFFWGLMRFIFGGANPEVQKGAKQMMIWSIIALFLMLSVWGLVRFIGSTLGVG